MFVCCVVLCRIVGGWGSIDAKYVDLFFGGGFVFSCRASRFRCSIRPTPVPTTSPRPHTDDDKHRRSWPSSPPQTTTTTRTATGASAAAKKRGTAAAPWTARRCCWTGWRWAPSLATSPPSSFRATRFVVVSGAHFWLFVSCAWGEVGSGNPKVTHNQNKPQTQQTHQEMEVLVDTGSSDLLVASTLCKTCDEVGK